jgi:hypothetical protein
MKSRSRCKATDICRISLMWEVPTPLYSSLVLTGWFMFRLPTHGLCKDRYSLDKGHVVLRDSLQRHSPPGVGLGANTASRILLLAGDHCSRWYDIVYSCVQARPWPRDLVAVNFFNPILFAICASTFCQSCTQTYTMACRRVLSSAPLYLIGSRPLVVLGNKT